MVEQLDVNMMEEDALQIPETSDLETLSSLVAEQLELEKSILELEGKLVSLQTKVKEIAEHKIPDIFTKLNLQDFKLTDGTKITVKPFYAASISPEKEELAFGWLRDHDFDDIIKHEVKALFGKGEDEQCTRLKEVLDELQLNYVDKQAIHPQTLKAFVKEQIESMSENLETDNKFPMELFNVYIGKKTKIEIPKQRRK